MPYIIQVGELVGAAILGGWISRILTIRSRVRQENAGASKAEAEAKADQIENIRKTMDDIYKPIIEELRKTMDDIYKPIIEELRKTAADAMAEAGEARKKADEAMDKVEALEKENRELRRENAQLRDAIREINPDLVPSLRGENGKSAPRSKDGRFVKRENVDGE